MRVFLLEIGLLPFAFDCSTRREIFLGRTGVGRLAWAMLRASLVVLTLVAPAFLCEPCSRSPHTFEVFPALAPN